jgi:hypothetical protein
MSKINLEFIDPSKGWLFGFLRPLPKNVNVNKWLLKCGYPEKLIKKYGDHFYCSYYSIESSEEEILEKFNMSKEDVIIKDDSNK